MQKKKNSGQCVQQDIFTWLKCIFINWRLRSNSQDIHKDISTLVKNVEALLSSNQVVATYSLEGENENAVCNKLNLKYRECIKPPHFHSHTKHTINPHRTKYKAIMPMGESRQCCYQILDILSIITGLRNPHPGS